MGNTYYTKQNKNITLNNNNNKAYLVSIHFIPGMILNTSSHYVFKIT